MNEPAKDPIPSLKVPVPSPAYPEGNGTFIFRVAPGTGAIPPLSNPCTGIVPCGVISGINVGCAHFLRKSTPAQGGGGTVGI